MLDIDNTQSQSVTATVCENAQLFGATPERDEFDPREVWDADDATDAVSEAFRIIAGRRRTRRLPARRRAREPALGVREHLRRPGAQARPRRRPAQPRAARPPARAGRNGNQVPRAGAGHRPRAEPRRPARTRSSRCATSQPTPTAQRPATPGDRDAAPTSRRPASSPRRPSTRATSCGRGRTARPGRTCPRERWSPSRAARTSPTRVPSSRASTRRRRSTRTSSSCTAAAPASSASPRSGQSRTASHQVVCKPDWNAHGRAAPFRRNDELLNLLPKGVIAFPGSGITDNLVDKAVALGIPVQRIAA